MFLIDCPSCGAREASEFTCRGQQTPRPARGEELTDEAWAAYLYMNANPAGERREWWFHDKGCGEWLRLRRDTTTNEVLEVMTDDPSR